MIFHERYHKNHRTQIHESVMYVGSSGIHTYIMRWSFERKDVVDSSRRVCAEEVVHASSFASRAP